jgi:hypothetical protein
MVLASGARPAEEMVNIFAACFHYGLWIPVHPFLLGLLDF